MSRVMIYDLETQLLSQDLPGEIQDIELMRVSMLAFARINWEKDSFNAFYTDVVRENEIEEFFKATNNSELMVGWGVTILNKALNMYDENYILSKKPVIDLKELTQMHSNGSIGMSSLADTLGVKKMGKTGRDAVDYFRKGHFYELSRFVIRDVNILTLYWRKIMDSQENANLLVMDNDNKQTGIRIHEIKKKILETMDVKPSDDFYTD